MRELRRTTSGDIATVPGKKIETPDTPAESGRNAQQPASDGDGNRTRWSFDSGRSDRNGGEVH
jgi:hypothetical protein